MEELKVCPNPWCESSEPEVRGGHARMNQVRCGHCGMDGPLRKTYEEAAEAWNDRSQWKMQIAFDKNLETISDLEKKIAAYLYALKFYAKGDHFEGELFDDFDSVSGEPDNWLMGSTWLFVGDLEKLKNLIDQSAIENGGFAKSFIEDPIKAHAEALAFEEREGI